MVWTRTKRFCSGVSLSMCFPPGRPLGSTCRRRIHPMGGGNNQDSRRGFACGWLFWEQQADLQTQRPITRVVRVRDVVKCLKGSIKGLMTHVEDLPTAAADRNCPLIS